MSQDGHNARRPLCLQQQMIALKLVSCLDYMHNLSDISIGHFDILLYPMSNRTF